MAGSFTGSPAKQERSTADQTYQRVEDKTYGSARFIALSAAEFKAKDREDH